uniref:Uncharacterized protein n=1 Tax=Arundo donax TaxID=35708 RepID=A0A0A9BAH3_ARUDO
MLGSFLRQQTKLFNEIDNSIFLIA